MCILQKICHKIVPKEDWKITKRILDGCNKHLIESGPSWRAALPNGICSKQKWRPWNGRSGIWKKKKWFLRQIINAWKGQVWSFVSRFNQVRKGPLLSFVVGIIYYYQFLPYSSVRLLFILMHTKPNNHFVLPCFCYQTPPPHTAPFLFLYLSIKGLIYQPGRLQKIPTE